MSSSSFKSRYSHMGSPRRIWTISAINGQLAPLQAIHQTVFDKFTPGDRLVYLGNYMCGQNARPAQTIDEILTFRRALLSLPGMMTDDIIYLRGIQEQLWSKLLQVQFATGPTGVLEWMGKQGIAPIVETYGSTLEEGLRSTREGVLSVTKWTMMLRDSLRAHAGHEQFFSSMRRAAFTEDKNGQDNNLLFVNAGIDPELSFVSQTDSFWWGHKKFDSMETPYQPFRCVIRGYDPEHKGVAINGVTASLDGGCGYGGELVCAQIDQSGTVLELLAA